MHDARLNRLTQQLVTFCDARDWKQFQNPKNLVAARSIEAAEKVRGSSKKYDEYTHED